MIELIVSWSWIIKRKFIGQLHYNINVCQFISVFVYPGKFNSIFTTQKYIQEFSCMFDLRYYPFDHQVSCTIIRRMTTIFILNFLLRYVK